MKKTCLRAGMCALFILAPTFVKAQTVVTSADLGGSVWNKAGSPYIVNDYLTIQPGMLTIEPGTVIEGDPSGGEQLYFQGGVDIEGSADDPILFEDLPNLIISGGTATIRNARFADAPISIYNATATLEHVSSDGADVAIAARAARVTATGVSISSSTYGIDAVYARPVLIGSRGIWPAVGSGILSFVGRPVSAQLADDPSQSHVSITDSSFERTRYAVYNATANVVHAEDDWWGSDAGPATAADATSSMVYGPVSYVPWKGMATATACCSSVLFVPGLESSRLSIDARQPLGTTTSQLWEPITNAQVKSLYLGPSGASLKPNIHATGLVDTALALKPIYQKFIDTMNGLAAAGTIAQWQAYPYDWRLPLTEAARGMIGTSTVVAAIERMASSSKTGKVTIVAHSNGGLVTKLVYDALRSKGEAGLVDKVVFVAVPELGTPQAIPSLLHGDGEEVADGVILSPGTARGLGVNMASSYSLLPDQDYFKAVPGAIIDFASSTLGGMGFPKYFPAIDSYARMKSFITDPSHGSLSDSTDVPLAANAGLFPQAESVHAELDAWRPASSTQLVAIAGWGMPTVVGVDYFQKVVCAAAGLLHLGSRQCSPSLEYSDVMSKAGDGTVAIQSALYSSSTKEVFDEGDYDLATGQSLAHGDILQADPVMTAVTDSIRGSLATASIPYMSDAAPAFAPDSELTIGVHSPATISIYDADGRHTGPIDNPISGSDLEMYESAIPGSQYREAGEQVYVTLPYRPDYSIDIDGDGIGSVEVTADVSDADSGRTIASSTFPDIPVTPLTHMEISSTTASIPYGSIKIDEDGDGTFDATSTPGAEPSVTADSYWGALDDCVRALHLKASDEKSLLARLAASLQALKKGNADRTDKAFLDLDGSRIGHFRSAKATDQDRARMHDLIEKMLQDFGS